MTWSTQDELRQRLYCVLDWIQQYGFCLHTDKCDFFQTSIGFIFDKSGRRSNPENTYVIQHMAAPTNLISLCFFLGLVSHYSIFCHKCTRCWVPSITFWKKDVPWNCSRECQFVFHEIKSLLVLIYLLTTNHPWILQLFRMLPTTDSEMLFRTFFRTEMKK